MQMLSACLIGRSRVVNRERDRRGARAKKPNQPSVDGFQLLYFSLFVL